MAVTWTYDGAGTLVATLSGAVNGDNYLLQCFDFDSSPDSAVASGGSVTLTVTGIGTAPDRFTAVIFHGDVGGTSSVTNPAVAANIFELGIASTTGYEYEATWAYDGTTGITVTITAASGVTYTLQARTTTAGFPGDTVTVGPFAAGTEQIISLTATTPDADHTDGFLARLYDDSGDQPEFTNRIFVPAVAGIGSPGNPTPPSAIEGVCVAFDDTLLEPSPAWTRIDNQVRTARWEIRRGRQDEREKTETGEATIFLHDTEGDFDPSNVSSTWFGKLDGKQVAIARWNPVEEEWQTRFRGYIEEYGYDLSPTQRVNEVAIVCVGFMDYLNSAEMAPGISGHPGGPTGVVFYDDQEINDRLHDIIEADAGIDPAMTVIFSGNVVLQETLYDGGYSYLAGAQDAADAEFPGISNLYEDRFGRIVFHGRHARFDPEAVAADAGTDAWDFHRWKAGDGAAIVGDADYAQLRPPLHSDRSLKLVINSSLVTPFGIDAADVAAQIVSDAPSIASYGVRSYNAPDLRVLEHKTNGDTGLQQCAKVSDFYVKNYSAPLTRPRQLTFKSLHPSDSRAAKTWDLMSRVDISDVVHLKVSLPGGGGFDEDYFVEGVTESSRPGGPWTPAGGEFTFDEVTLDVSPVAFYNEDTFPDDGVGA